MGKVKEVSQGWCNILGAAMWESFPSINRPEGRGVGRSSGYKQRGLKPTPKGQRGRVAAAVKTSS